MLCKYLRCQTVTSKYYKLIYGLKTLIYCPHNITKSRVSVQSMSRLLNLNLFFLFGTFVPLVTNKYSNSPKH